MSTEKNVYQRIYDVANEIGTIEKNGRNDFHKYDYATEADFVHALRPLLNKHRLVIVPSVASIPQLVNGITELTMKFTIVNIDNPSDKVDMLIPGQGQDKGDKGVYKALTGAKKYFIALAFMVATGDDPEKEEKEKTAKFLGDTPKKVTTTNDEKAKLVETAALATTTSTARRPSFRKNVTVVGDDI